VKRDYVVAALALLALVAVSVLTKPAPSTPPPTRASADFGYGGYRGWYELLRREGLRVGRFDRHHDALPASRVDTLIIAFPGDGVPVLWNVAERDALRAWVRGGGRLVDIGLTPPAGKGDDKDERVFLDETNGDGGALRGPWSALVAALSGRGTFRLVTAPHKHVETLLRDKAGMLVVRYRYGKGEVVGVSDAGFFENDALAHGDAARLAFLVAQPKRAGGLVAFDEAVRTDVAEKPWYRALTAPELVALALAALAGLLWLLYGIVPLGPPVRLRAPREPTSDEFIDAVAALYERARARDHARDALVADLRRTVARAPNTPEYRGFAERAAHAAMQPITDDAALVDVARLARTAREETIRATNPDRRLASPARRAGPRRRRR